MARPTRAIRSYLADLAERLRATAPALTGVYAGGSLALGAYDPGRSDVDVAAVVEEPLAQPEKEEVVATTRHESLACPARGLELVVYAADAVAVPSVEPRFELNLNTGPRMTFRVDYAPVPGERHWFALDRAILAERGVAITGPAARHVFAPLPRALVLPVLRESLLWHLREDAPADDAVLNACRALRYHSDATWASKPDAGRWALARVADAATVEAALAARSGAGAVGADAGRAFVASALETLSTAGGR